MKTVFRFTLIALAFASTARLSSAAVTTSLDQSNRTWTDSRNISLSSRVRVASNIIIPQNRAIAFTQEKRISITGITVGVVISEQVATTTMDVTIQNTSRTLQEAELLLPVPEGALVKGFSFQGNAAEPTARLLPADEARRTYDAIVAKVRDPALLEFAGYNMIRSSVFPVPAGGRQKIRLTYELLLLADGNRIDYILPRTEQLDNPVPWSITCRIKSTRPISTLYSPSHKLDVIRKSPRTISARISKSAQTEPGSFRLSYLLENGELTASLMAYPDPTSSGGYFMMLAGLPTTLPDEDRTSVMKREVIITIDRSGSMRGEKLEQVKEASLQILEGLKRGEAFNIIIYNECVDSFAETPVIKTRDTMNNARKFLDDTYARGGTNIHDALVETLKSKPQKNMLPLVLFLTDGLPTIGQTSEAVIRKTILAANIHNRRIYTFGVGCDVNTPLLNKLASATRAVATYVLPKENLELKVASVFRRLSTPFLASPQLFEMNSIPLTNSINRLYDIIPFGKNMPDLFKGDQLVVFGRYRGNTPLTIMLDGNYLGRRKSFTFNFSLENASVKNSFIPRLWASRQIGVLLEAIRELGADGNYPQHNPVPNDPRAKELIDEVIHLSTKFGILTEYTAFLALEGTDLTMQDQITKEAHYNFRRRSFGMRSGVSSINQEFNSSFMRSQLTSNSGNKYYDENMNRVSVSTVRQVGNRTYYLRGGRWIDSELASQGNTVTPDHIVWYGTNAYEELKKKLKMEGQENSASLGKEVIMQVDGKAILYKFEKSAK